MEAIAEGRMLIVFWKCFEKFFRESTTGAENAAVGRKRGRF
jgi:hypothetical protein